MRANCTNDRYGVHSEATCRSFRLCRHLCWPVTAGSTYSMLTPLNMLQQFREPVPAHMCRVVMPAGGINQDFLCPVEFITNPHHQQMQQLYNLRYQQQLQQPLQTAGDIAGVGVQQGIGHVVTSAVTAGASMGAAAGAGRGAAAGGGQQRVSRGAAAGVAAAGADTRAYYRANPKALRGMFKCETSAAAATGTSTATRGCPGPDKGHGPADIHEHQTEPAVAAAAPQKVPVAARWVGNLNGKAAAVAAATGRVGPGSGKVIRKVKTAEDVEFVTMEQYCADVAKMQLTNEQQELDGGELTPWEAAAEEAAAARSVVIRAAKSVMETIPGDPSRIHMMVDVAIARAATAHCELQKLSCRPAVMEGVNVKGLLEDTEKAFLKIVFSLFEESTGAAAVACTEPGAAPSSETGAAASVNQEGQGMGAGAGADAVQGGGQAQGEVHAGWQGGGQAQGKGQAGGQGEGQGQGHAGGRGEGQGQWREHP